MPKTRTCGGTPFITMAYVQGESLSQFASANRQWPERDVAKLVRKIAVALAEAHAKGVVHRDLKPGNIMLDQRHEPIAMDFGLAGGIGQPGDETLTHTGMVIQSCGALKTGPSWVRRGGFHEIRVDRPARMRRHRNRKTV